MEEKERLGSLWVQESKGGTKYMKGVISIAGHETRIVIFRNKTKKSEKSPDFSIFESVPFQKSTPQPTQQQRQAEVVEKVFGDDIPF
jgi:hypothetical protein